jgi:hypothetical protein
VQWRLHQGIFTAKEVAGILNKAAAVKNEIGGEEGAQAAMGVLLEESSKLGLEIVALGGAFKVAGKVYATASEAYLAATKSIKLPAQVSAQLATSGVSLNRKLLLDEIVDHSYNKHVIEQKEFVDLGIKTKDEFKKFVNQVIENPSDIRYYKDGRIVYLQESTHTVVIKNGISGPSTAFRPENWDNFLNTKIPSLNTPPL